MAFEWAQFLQVAQELAQAEGVDREASLRSAIGRAYYAAFNCGKQYCEAHGRSFRNDGTDHERVREQLRGLDLTDLADDLFRMHEWRKIADYQQGHFAFGLMWAGTETSAQRIIDATRVDP